MRTAFAIVLALLLAGCDQQQGDTGRRDPLATSPLFADGAASRLPPDGTVAADADLAPPADRLPEPLTKAMLERGRNRYDIFCSPCHDYTGHGNGRVVQRGFPAPPDFHSVDLKALNDRAFFDVITNGYGAMLPYGPRVNPDDRWAIVAYIRALQLAEDVPAEDLTEALRERLAEVSQ